jgi:hypothetical protein
MQLDTRPRIGQKMLAALCFIKHHPGCAKIDVALAIHPGSTRSLHSSFAAGYKTVDACIAGGFVRAELDISARVTVYQLTVTPKGFALLNEKADAT